VAPSAVTDAAREEARHQATALIRSVFQAEPALLRLGNVDLAGAVEQQLFFAVRDGASARGPGPASAAALGRSVAASALGTVDGARRPRVAPGGAVVLVRDPTHDTVVERLAALLAADHVSLAAIRTGRAAATSGPSGLPSTTLQSFVRVGDLPALWALEARRLARLTRATAGWQEIAGERAAELRRVMQRELSRIALGAAALSGAVRAWRPRVLVAFDEIGTWARLLPAVARAHGIASLDLPHAEAADAAAIRGASYDRMAVYGARAAEVLRAAGVDSARVVEIGAPRFDTLIEAAANRAITPDRRRIVFAAQYITGRMTPELLEATQGAAFEAARAAAPAELVVVRHPAAEHQASLPDAVAGVGVRRSKVGLHAELIGAWLMVTSWSNSVFEAAIAGVPAMTVAPPGVAPVDFAADGLAIAAADPGGAAAETLKLLDPDAHHAAVERARVALGSRLGPLDGAATERAAALVRELIGGQRGAGT